MKNDTRQSPSVPVSATGSPRSPQRDGSQHTAGPWRVAKSRGLNSYEVKGAAGEYIADVWGADDPVPNGVRPSAVKANARVIGASLDLLAACKEAEDLLSGAGYSTHELRAAIAKAEGR